MTDRKKPKPSKENGKPEDSTAIVLQSGPGSISSLPEAVQQQLSKYTVRKRPGLEPLWPHDHEGDYIIGTIISARDAGQFGSKIIVMESKVTGNDKTKDWTAEEKFYSIWLTSDLDTKLNAEEDGLINRRLFIRFDGWLTKKDNPSLKNDMKLYTVQEFFPDEK